LRVASTAWLEDERAATVLKWAALAYAAAWAVHTADHVRRGPGSLTAEVFAAGGLAAIAQLSAVALVLIGWRGAPLIAVWVGLVDAAGIAAVHFLPHWSVFSDAFPGAHGTGVTAFSWFAAVSETVAALAFGIAGAYALRAARVRAAAPPRALARGGG
jgi:hypothetical protein